MKKIIVMVIICIFIGTLASVFVLYQNSLNIHAISNEGSGSSGGWVDFTETFLDEGWDDEEDPDVAAYYAVWGYEEEEEDEGWDDNTFHFGDDTVTDNNSTSNFDSNFKYNYDDKYSSQLEKIKENYYQNTGVQWKDLSFDDQTAILRGYSDYRAAATKNLIEGNDFLKYGYNEDGKINFPTTDKVFGDLINNDDFRKAVAGNSAAAIRFNQIIDTSQQLVDSLEVLGTDAVSKSGFQAAIDSVKNKIQSPEMKSWLTNLGKKVANGEITPQEAKKELENAAKAKGVVESVKDIVFGEVKAPVLPKYGPDTWEDVAQNIIGLLLKIVGIAFVIMFFVAGVMMITSSGSEEQFEKAKTTMLNATIGIVVVALSWTAITFVSQQLEQSEKNATSEDTTTASPTPTTPVATSPAPTSPTPTTPKPTSPAPTSPTPTTSTK